MGIEPSDVLFLIIILWIVVEIINNGDWGGGHRARVPAA